ncbi:diacylglycerol/lipid kinase family protein, partial [Escherichia coli]
QSYSFHVEVDGKKEEIESSTLLIGLTNSVGGFETLLPNAKVDDGKLHLVYLKDSSLIDTLKTLPDLLKGVDESTKNLAYLTCEQ